MILKNIITLHCLKLCNKELLNDFRQLFIFLFIVLGFNNNLFSSENDTIIFYNSITGEQTSIPFPAIDTSISEDFEHGNIGTMGNITELELSLPSTPPESTFTVLEKVDYNFDLLSYPVRTNVKLFIYYSDSEIPGECSGTLIANNFVLTAGHCIFRQNNKVEWPDSVVVIPSYSNGNQQLSIGNSISSKFYVFKLFLLGNFGNDMALVQLEEPLGNFIGWMGYGFTELAQIDSFYFKNTFYHFSYPAALTAGYTGDDMYFNYGSFNDQSYTQIGNGITGIGGESGSGFFYTDNNKYIIYGIIIFSKGHQYLLITHNKFYTIKYIIENNSADSSSNNDESFTILVYPNPVKDILKIQLFFRFNKNINVSLYNILGKKIMEIYDGNLFGGSIIESNLVNLSSGLYLLKIVESGNQYTIKLVLQK